MSIMDYDSPLNTLIGKTIDLILLSALWFICCLPVVTIGASTTALYYATVKSVRKNREYAAKNFLKAFRQNFLPATLMWLFFGIMAVVLYICFVFASAVQEDSFRFFMMTVYLFMSFVILSMACYSFPVLSRCSMKCGEIIRFSFGLMIRHFPSTLVMVLIVAAAACVMWIIPLTVFCIPAAGTLLYSFFMERILIRYTPDNEKNGWYAEGDGI